MTSQPAIALLSNGSYGVMITSACAGYSTWREMDVTRWREDATRDCWGQFFYVRDVHDDRTWSIGTQPLVRSGDPPDFDVHVGRAELRRRDGDVETRCAVCVVPDADAELRVVTLVNHGRSRREFELTKFDMNEDLAEWVSVELEAGPAAPTVAASETAAQKSKTVPAAPASGKSGDPARPSSDKK